MSSYHLDIVLHSRIANPSLIFTISEVLPVGEIARETALFFDGLFEKSIPKAELTQHTVIVYSMAYNYPEPDASDSIVELPGKFIFPAWLVKQGKINLHERSPIKVFNRRFWSSPWFYESLFGR